MTDTAKLFGIIACTIFYGSCAQLLLTALAFNRASLYGAPALDMLVLVALAAAVAAWLWSCAKIWRL